MQAPAKERKQGSQSAGTEAAASRAATSVRPECVDEDGLNDIRAEVDYLIAAGWVKVLPGESPNPLKRWQDPHSGQSDRKVLVVHEARDAAGRVTTAAVYQNYAGTPPWYYTRQEAVAEQHHRDREVAKGAKR